MERVRSPLVTLHAPHVIDLEVTQALRRYVTLGVLEQDRAEVALRHLSQLDLNRYAHEPFLPRIWALRDNLTAYDAAYVSLAEALEATLLTRDERLARAPGVAALVELLR